MRALCNGKVQTVTISQDHTQTQGEESCPGCGTTSRPTLLPGTGPHACKAVCSHCGRFIKWISVLSPSERLARRMKSRLAAMLKHPPSEAQLAYLKALGDKLAAPQSMGEASERIEALKQGKRQ